MAAKAHLFGIVGAEFVAKELTVWCTPRLQLSVHDRQTFSAKRAAGRWVVVALVVVGSLLIMADLNDNMMPAAELMNLQMQH